MKSIKNINLFILATFVFIVISYLALDKANVLAQGSGYTISGYAWSENIGWISMSGGGYGISVSSSGTLSGYAWSDNIGWVSANASDLSGCPSSPCSASINADGSFRGWLRAISGNTSQSGGWDGFISLNGSNYGVVRSSTGSLSGYGWGSTVVGWLNFQYASTNYSAAPTAELVVRKLGSSTWASNLTIETTDEIEIGWNQNGTTNTASCSAVPPAYGFSTGDTSSGIDSDVEEPIGNTSNTYRVLCYSPSGQQLADSVTVSTNGGVGARFCPGSEVDFVRRGEDVSLCWELGTNNPAMCSIKAGEFTVLSPLPSTSGTVTHNMDGEVKFTLECIGGDGDDMTVKVLPDVQET